MKNEIELKLSRGRYRSIIEAIEMSMTLASGSLYSTLFNRTRAISIELLVENSELIKSTGDLLFPKEYVDSRKKNKYYREIHALYNKMKDYDFIEDEHVIKLNEFEMKLLNEAIERMYAMNSGDFIIALMRFIEGNDNATLIESDLLEMKELLFPHLEMDETYSIESNEMPKQINRAYKVRRQLKKKLKKK